MLVVHDIDTLRHAAEVRFDARGGMLGKGGLVADQFRSPPFVHWTVTSTPFRVQLHDEKSTKIVFATHKNLGAEMEVPDTDGVFVDQWRRWSKQLLHADFLGAEIGVVRLGYRAWQFAPVVGGDYGQLVALLDNRFFATGIFDKMAVKDNSQTLILTCPDYDVRLMFGPMSPQEAKDQAWLRTEAAIEKAPELAVAIDIDIYRTFTSPQPMNLQKITRFVTDSLAVSREMGMAIVHRLQEVG